MYMVSTYIPLLTLKLVDVTTGAFEYIRGLRYGESLILMVSGLFLIIASSVLRRLLYRQPAVEHAVAARQRLMPANSTTEASGRTSQ